MQQLTASAANINSVTFTVLARPGSPAKVNPTAGSQQTGVVGSVLDLPTTASVIDAYGNSVPAVPVTFTLSADGGSLTDTIVRTDDRGEARTTWTIGAKAGQHELYAAVATLPAAVFRAQAIPALGIQPSRLDFIPAR